MFLQWNLTIIINMKIASAIGKKTKVTAGEMPHVVLNGGIFVNFVRQVRGCLSFSQFFSQIFLLNCRLQRIYDEFCCKKSCLQVN